MKKYELEKSIELMNMVVELLTNHLPSIYVTDVIPKAIDARKRMEEELKQK